MRQSLLVAAACCVIAVIGCATASAQVPSAAAAQTSRIGREAAAGTLMKPFSRLFAPAGQDRGSMLRLTAPAPRLGPPQICGMKVLRPDPRIDPKFEVPLRDTWTQFTIRIVPSLCQ